MPKKYPHLKVKNSSIHRRGVFAASDLPKGMRVIEYTGRKLSYDQAEYSKSDYLFQVNRKTFIDGRNTARYINHSCYPNCEIIISKGRIWIDTTRPIRKGEELAYNYSFDLKESKDYPCACGSEKCVGFILDEYYWPKFKKQQKQRKRAGSRS